MTKKILFVDGNSIFHANHNSTPLTVGGMQVQAIFGTLRSLHKLMQETPGDKEMMVVWDGHAQFRFDLFPEYKGNRVAKDAAEEAHKEARKKQAPFIEKMIAMLGIRQYRCPTLEADDLAGLMIPTMVKRGYEVIMVTGDRDWIQMVDSRVTWLDPIRDRKVDTSNFLEFTGYFTTEAYVQGKALVGDDSDNIKGIYKLGDKTASLLLAQWKDMNCFFEAIDAGEYTPKARASKTATSLHPEQLLASPEGRALFQRNVKLMDWSLTPRSELAKTVLTHQKPDIANFELLCQKLAFASILRNLDSFLRAFKIENTKEIA